MIGVSDLSGGFYPPLACGSIPTPEQVFLEELFRGFFFEVSDFLGVTAMSRDVRLRSYSTDVGMRPGRIPIVSSSRDDKP